MGVAAFGDALRVHVCQLCVAPYRQSLQSHHGPGFLGAHVQVCGRLLRLRPGGLHGHGGLLPDGHVQLADKNDDKACDLAVLGARVVLNVAAMSVSAAVDPNKAQRWATELMCMTKVKKCSPDQAAKYAGRLAFTCTVAAGRQGRAFVKPFYAQANAPLRGFDMSPALLNAASWWTKFLELKLSVRLAVGHTTRTTVWAWTDASGEDPCLGVVVYARGSWYYTYLDAPPAVFDQLLHRQDSQINFLEMPAVLLFVTTFQNIICGTAAFVFIDNNSVLGSLLKGSSSAPEANMLTGRIWLHAAEWSWAPSLGEG